MKNTSKLLSLFAAAAFVAACGGATKTSKKGMTKIAGEAPPPPSGSAKTIDRTVSRAVEKDFDAAVAFYNAKAKEGWSESNCRDASDKFQSIVGDNSKMIEARFNSGLALQNCGMNKAAEGEYQKALKINPGHAESLSNLGEIYFKGGNESRAKQYWEKAVNADGKIVAARNNLAWLIIRDIRSGKASLKSSQTKVKGMLSRALAVDNDNVEAYTLYGLLYIEGSQKNKSRLTLAKLLLDTGAKIDAKYAPLHNAYGLLKLAQDNVPSALESFRRAVALNPKFKEAHRNLGNIVLDFRKYDEAKASFEKVLQLDNKDYDAHIGMGYALRGLKDYDGAEASYKKAYSLDSSRAEADYNLGILYQDFRSNATEDLKEAQKAFRTASTFFNKAKSKPKASAKLKKEAAGNIKACDKNVKSLDQAIKFRAQMDKG
jgi:tetratricopeptide (TPR) repeat protein